MSASRDRPPGALMASAALWIPAFAGMTGGGVTGVGFRPWERGRPARKAALARGAPSP